MLKSYLKFLPSIFELTILIFTIQDATPTEAAETSEPADATNTTSNAVNEPVEAQPEAVAASNNDESAVELPPAGNGSSPSQIIETTSADASGQHSSLDPTVDPTKPDLLGDIAHEHNQPQNNSNGGNEVMASDPEAEQNDAQDHPEEPVEPQDVLEKGIVDMNISEQAKDEEQIMNA